MLNDGVIKVAVLFPELQEPGNLLLFVLLHSQEAGAIDGYYHLLQGSQQLPGLLALAVVQHVIDQIDEV